MLRVLSADLNSTGGQIGHLPIICTSGSATFKAALRVRIQAGTTVEVFGTGFDFELGVYADLIEYVATIGTSDSCELYITEVVDVNIGAFAHAVLELDYKTFGASPAIVTTLLDYALPSLCLTRPVDTSLPVLPTATATPITSPVAQISSSYSSGSTPTAKASATSTGAIFFQGSSSYVTSTSAAPSGAASGSYVASGSGLAASSTGSPTPYGNGTVTSAPSMIVSTIYTTDLVTITSCAETVLHCPAESTSEIIITSTAILYTTVCPVGQVQPTFTTTASPTIVSQLANTSSVIVSPVPLTPCPTPIISTVYTPTFVNPTYTMPSATSFTVPNPNWNATTSSFSSPAAPTSASGNEGSVGTVTVVPTSASGGSEKSATTITVAPTFSSSSAPIESVYRANSTVLATGSAKVQPTAPATFTGGAIQPLKGSAFGAIVALGFSIFVLL